MSPLPRALRRARVWTAGALTASTVLVGAIGVHLADAQTQTVATSTTSTSSDTSSDTSSSDASLSDTASDSGSSAFSAVSPVSGSDSQAQTSSGGS